MEKPQQKEPYLPLLSENSPANYYSSNSGKASSGSSLKTRILSLTDTGLRLLNTGRVSEGLATYSSMYNLLKNMDDPNTLEFQKSFENTIEDLNKIAMRFVQHGDTESGHQVLTFCEEVTQPGKYGDFPLSRTTTFNNLACLYRRIGKPKGALNYLRTALTILNKKNLLHHSATTYLNLSAVHSQLGDHQQALTNAKNALLHAQEELLLYKDDVDSNKEKYKEKVVMLSIAYHNIGSEEEHLKNFTSSLNWYEKAYTVMDEYGIVDEKLYKKFKSVHLAAQDKVLIMDLKSVSKGSSPQSNRRAFTPDRSIEYSSRGASPKHSFGEVIRPIGFDVRHHMSPTSHTGFMFKEKKIVNRKKSKSKKSVPKPIIIHSGLKFGDKPPLSGHRRSGSGSASTKQVMRPLLMSAGVPSSQSSKNFSIKKNMTSPSPIPRNVQRDMNQSLGENDPSPSYYNSGYMSPPYGTTRGYESHWASPHDEIRQLEEAGVLEWSDDEKKSKRKKQEKDEIKRNQTNFISQLKEAGVKVISGEVKLIDTSSSSSSSSSSEDESSLEKFKKSKKNKKKKEKKEKEKRYKSEISTYSQQPPRQSSEAIEEDEAIKHVDEDFAGSGDDLISVSVSNVYKKSPKSASKIEKEKSLANISQKKSQVFGGIASNILSKSLARDESSQSLTSVKSTKSRKSSKKRTLNKFELEQMRLIRSQSALTIQKNYRGKLARDKYKLMKERREKYGERYLIKKKYIILEPYKAEDKQNVKQEPRDYYLTVTAYVQNEMLHFNLIDCTEKLHYNTEISYKDVPIKKKKSVMNSYNRRLLDEFSEETIPRLLIIDHLLYINATKLNQGTSKKQEKHVTFDLNESAESDLGPTKKPFIPINMKQHGKEILKIQSHMRGKLARDEAKFLQERRWRFLFVHTFKQDDQWVKFRLLQRIDSGNFYATALHILKNKTFNRLEIPEILVASLRKQYANLINKLEFDLEHTTMNFLPAVEVKLFPETRQKYIKRIEDSHVIKIQKHMRRYLAQQWFKLRLKKHRENPNTILLRKYPILEGKHLFTCRVFYNQEQKIISVTAKSEDYIAEIRPLILSLREVDRHQFNDTISNLRRLADIISPYVTIEYNKHDVYVLGFDKREFERNGRRLEAQLQSYTDLDILGLHNGIENGEETRTKVWQYLQDKSFIEANKHIIMNVLGIQSVRETIKIIEDQEPSIKNLGENENAAARRIQKFYRKILLQRYLKNQAENPKQISIRESASLILANSLRGRSYSLFCEAYHRMVITEEELRRQSTSDRLFLKTIPRIEFSNTNLEARAHIFQSKQESKDKVFDVEVIVPIIGLHDHIIIAESDISNTSLKPTTLIKKIDELLINRLGYNPVTKRVYFSKDLVNNKGADGEETGVHKLKISPYIQAKLTRLKYLRRRARTKDMTLVKMQTVEVDRTYVNMSYYWYQPRRQLRIMVEQIDALQHYKEIIVKFDNIQTTSELRGLINDMNTETNEFIEKMKPYLNYIASHIVLQPESKVRNVATAREFKILMDSSIFNLEFANSKFVLASLKEIPIETLNNILLKAQQVDIKFLLRSNKLIDVQQFEKMFNNKINLDDLLNDDKKEDPKAKRESDQTDSKVPTLNMDSLFMKGATIEEPALKSKKKTREDYEAAAQLIQGKFRKYKDQDKFKLMKRSKELGRKALEGYGKKIKKTVKKIENHYWTIHVYRKVQAEKNMTLYYFSAVSVKEGPGAVRMHAKGMYRADNMLLINSAGKGLIDFLIERMEINGQTIEFNLNLEQTNNYVKIETPEPKRIERSQEEDEVQYGSQSNSARSFSEDRPKDLEEGPMAAAPENKRKVPKIAIKPHNRSSKKLQTIAEEGAPGEGKTVGEEKETPTPTPESTLLQQKAESLLNTLLLYNVYYNQDEEEGDSADKPTLKPLDGLTSPTGRDDENTPGPENVIKISVEMEELKKYVPNLSVKNSQDLKVIAAELANSIQINEKGEVLVNSTKINPNALSVTEKKLSIQENPDNKPSKDKNNKKKVLFKMTKAYGDKKYLVLINYIEKLSTINGVMSLAGREDDKVYEDFELFIEVSAVCLSHSAIKPLVWELALQEAQKLSGLANTAKIAKFFANNIHVFGDQLLLSTPFNYYVNEKNVMIMNENVIKTIQNRFRTRKFTKNFIRFKETLITLKPKNPERAIINLNNVSYNVLGYEKSPTELEIMTWDLTNYEKHSILLKKATVEKIYARDRRRAYHYIFKFLTFEFNNKKEYILALREKNMIDYLQKEGEM